MADTRGVIFLPLRPMSRFSLPGSDSPLSSSSSFCRRKQTNKLSFLPCFWRHRPIVCLQCARAPTHARTHTHTHARTRMYAHARTRTHARTHTHTASVYAANHVCKEIHNLCRLSANDKRQLDIFSRKGTLFGLRQQSAHEHFGISTGINYVNP